MTFTETPESPVSKDGDEESKNAKPKGENCGSTPVVSGFTKKLFIGVAVFIFLLAGLTYAGLQWYSRRAANNSAAPSSAQDNARENRIEYTRNAFIPNLLNLSITKGLGCIVNIVNKSDKPLAIAISPNHKKTDPSPLYISLDPGKNELFDPRFTGISQLTYYDQSNPVLHFLVTFDKSCQ
ncbi:MAG: hypothetical protein HY220_03645 [Candidatus Sungbacteria bacterium]|uniref:Transmembrane protein n=1 Tax=Candidatus Sungiibacteriota bacterium TaxID=2750080 RepID=A0A9D6QS97_9BACT|nr:hypothetical protein [Candidatus Sungbacteria bacterium]